MLCVTGSISIHALREEGDISDRLSAMGSSYFYPRPPRGGRLAVFSALACESSNFYPRPPRGGRLIHSLLHNHFSLFLSTPSARRATKRIYHCECRSVYFYPRPPRGGRPDRVECFLFGRFISIHALREEGDETSFSCFLIFDTFLSTPSARRATCSARLLSQTRQNFYPRPPRGGRQQKRRKTSPLLFHYKTICTDLEELVQKHPKKQLRSAQNGLKTWCEGDGKGVSAFHSHRGEQARRSARLRIQTGDAPRCARPWSYSCCPVDKTADCPDRGR